MSDARQALGAAREAQARVLAPGLMEQAEQDLGRAVTALSAHDYSAARSSARAARERALVARRLSLALAKARAGLRTAASRGIAEAPIRRLITAVGAALERQDVQRAISLAEQAARAVGGGSLQ